MFQYQQRHKLALTTEKCSKLYILSFANLIITGMTTLKQVNDKRHKSDPPI